MTEPGQIIGFVDLVESPVVPPRTAYLMPRTNFAGPGYSITGTVAPMLWECDPWPQRTHSGPLADVVAEERGKALDHLAGLLDDWCTEMGMDPSKTWREPKVREEQRWMQNWRVEERIGLAVLNPRGQVSVIKGIA